MWVRACFGRTCWRRPSRRRTLWSPTSWPSDATWRMRERSVEIPVPEGVANIVSLDSTKPDLDEGEVGREHYGWLDSEFRHWDRGPRILMIHHHILAVPGTGRDVNNLRDAGDVMAILRELKIDMVLSGHRHVPYVWSISGG